MSIGVGASQAFVEGGSMIALELVLVTGCLQAGLQRPHGQGTGRVVGIMLETQFGQRCRRGRDFSRDARQGVGESVARLSQCISLATQPSDEVGGALQVRSGRGQGGLLRRQRQRQRVDEGAPLL